MYHTAYSIMILSYVLLDHLLGFSEKFLQEWQAGFREARGCRDNSMILPICEKILELDKSLAAVFIDYSAAFDSVSRKFVDIALKKLASPKIRIITGAIYHSVSTFTTVSGVDGRTCKSDSFLITRGVLQGDVISPLFFIMVFVGTNS